ncbi:MAG: cation diffusion facilitator family transporter [Candidatus Omnitrophica bacterium]|nr:cation diffusion facilitator family transporter [Candidatus Omnitrophota bacterium]
MTLESHLHHHPKDKIGRLKFVLVITGFGMVLEFAGGIISNSLALISDAGHMLTHLFALGMSYFAVKLSMRPLTKKRTYGFYRAEVLAAFINGIVLIFICGYIVYEAAVRFINPKEINMLQMLFVAAIGLLINGISTSLLFRASQHDLNIRSAFLHEITDMVSSIAVLGAGLFIYFTGKHIADPLVSFFICALIVVWAVRLLIESGNILLEATPKHLDIDEMTKTLKREIPDIHEVHHVHAWTIASSMYALTAHVVTDDCSISKANEILQRINALLKEKFHIAHTNIQFECKAK